MEHYWEDGTADRCRIRILPRLLATDHPFCEKHDRPVAPCLRYIDSPTAAAQHTIGLDWRGGRASFLSQW